MLAGNVLAAVEEGRAAQQRPLGTLVPFQAAVGLKALTRLEVEAAVAGGDEPPQLGIAA